MKNNKTDRFIFYYLPRIVAIIMILVFTVKSVINVTGMNESGLRLLKLSVIHLIPAFIILAGLLIAWKNEYMGGLIFLSLGVIYTLLAWNLTSFFQIAIITVPLLLTGVLLLINNKRNKPGTAETETDNKELY